MPLIVGQWKMDNFYKRPSFQKMPNCLHDCYFYYYSSCTKGDNCEFRHEPSALGHETMCSKWLDGSCNDVKCVHRHMLIKKNRSLIPCFFESQPAGCKKAHCVFKHNQNESHMHNATTESGVADVSTDGGN
ncbi:Zinc finger CCCH domain-containing protein 11A [Pseudolycoriella hygida]|uniref:Zinc finger CCCH domain-containing protein 11A n=1 Tax=Pseudolycoriella hygida TaxID=35572 RepID=A0A9Q0S8H7_9DIPT|nr:Zinc finger CCCH domain-containing protein 11A [Pseudolycoriella hygida]